MPLQRLIRRLPSKRLRAALAELTKVPNAVPLKGFQPAKAPAGFVDLLTDGELEELNSLLPWKCFTADASGRRFGWPASASKRNVPQEIPDYRTPMLDAEFSLRGKHVLEVGCFEGVHTTGLATLGATVTAIDSRMENVVKTMVRTGFHGYPVKVFKCDVEKSEDFARLPEADIVHHIGVLYHLKDPVSHLLAMGRLAKVGVMLDTHIARPEEATRSYRAAGREFSYKHYREGGYENVFAGMYDHAKWLTLNTIRLLLTEIGFGRIRVIEERDERNGPRVLLIAARR